jgi:hypothetical protein
MTKRKWDGSVIVPKKINKRNGDELTSELNKKLRLYEYWHQQPLSRVERAKYMASIYTHLLKVKY